MKNINNGRVTCVIIFLLSSVATMAQAGRIKPPTKPQTKTTTKTPKPAKPTTGTLSITSTPSDAVIKIDGEYMGTTPLTLKNRKAGTYSITFSAEGYESMTQSVSVTAGKTATCIATLKKKQMSVTQMTIDEFIYNPTDSLAACSQYQLKNQDGSYCAIIKVVTTDYDLTFIGPERVQRFGDAILVWIPKNLHVLNISHPKLGSIDYDIPIALQEKGTYTLLLNPGGGRFVNITSRGSDKAHITIDNQDIGETPIYNYYMPYGNHHVNATAGYYLADTLYHVSAGEGFMTLNLNMQANDLDFTANGVSFKMIRVEGGTFTMGATSEQGSDAYDDEKPAHQVTLSSYYLGETEVTQELWQAVMGSNPSKFKGADRPIENVSWDDCQTFIRKLNSLTGKTFRLPTEAEWEYAARGGNKSQGYKYSGSNTVGNVAWFDDNSGSKTHSVKIKSPNELGIYDMSGNVWEWCQDWYGSYSSSPQTNSTGPASGSGRVDRGGGWGNNARGCRVSFRDYITPDFRSYRLGFRLVL